jgi:hypothetical protein
MKKLIILMLLAFTTFTSTAQLAETSISEKETTTLSETERIVDKYSGKIVDNFVILIESAAPHIKEGFKMVVRLQIAKGIAYLLPLLFFIVFLILTFIEYNRIEKLINSENIPDYMGSNEGVFFERNISFKIIFYLGLTVITACMAVVFTYDGVVHLMAPDWFAIKEIQTLIK